MDAGEVLMEMGGCGLYVAEFHRLEQSFHGIPGRNELLTHVALVPNVQQLTHYGWVIDLLRVIELFAPWITCGMHMSDNVFTFLDSADHVTIHDLNVINVE